MPADLRKVVAASPLAKAQWNDLTPLARNDFVMWIDSAKQSETRQRRIESVPSRLASGKRRPCCFAIVPMLTSLERRDFASWVDSGKDSETRRKRVEKTCLMVAAERRHP